MDGTKISKFSEFIETYSAIISGVLVSIGIWLFLYFKKIYINLESISSLASLTTQVLGTYVGLVLTSYAILHATRLPLSSSDDDLKSKLKLLNSTLHMTFVSTLQWLIWLTLIVFLIFCSAELASQNLEIRFLSPHWGLSRICVAIIAGSMVLGSIEIICTVKTLYNVRID